MTALLNSRIFKSSLGLSAGFIGAFVGVFASRVYLANNLDIDTLNILFALSSLIALSVVLSVEGFTSSLPVTFKSPIVYLRALTLVNVVLNVVTVLIVFSVSALLSAEFSFIFDYWYLFLLGLGVVMTVSFGQLVETAAAVVGKNVIPVWRRTSIQFAALGLFMVVLLLVNESSGASTVALWFGCMILGGLIAAVSSLWFLLRGIGASDEGSEREGSEQRGFVETWQLNMKTYWGHHFGKLGLVLPRFMIPVLVLSLFGSEVNVDFVILWTVLGLVSMAVSAVSRGYMSHFEDSGSWRDAWKSWIVLILLPMLVLAFLATPVMGAFGDEFRSLNELLLVGLLSMVPFSVLDLYSARLRSFGLVRSASVLTVSSGAVLVAVVVALGSVWGLSGIMWSYVIVYSVFALLAVVSGERRNESIVSMSDIAGSFGGKSE